MSILATFGHQTKTFDEKANIKNRFEVPLFVLVGTAAAIWEEKLEKVW